MVSVKQICEPYQFNVIDKVLSIYYLFENFIESV